MTPNDRKNGKTWKGGGAQLAQQIYDLVWLFGANELPFRFYEDFEKEMPSEEFITF